MGHGPYFEPGPGEPFLPGVPINQREQIPLELEPQFRLDVHDWGGAETEGGSAHGCISRERGVSV